MVIQVDPIDISWKFHIISILYAMVNTPRKKLIVFLTFGKIFSYLSDYPQRLCFGRIIMYGDDMEQ